MVLSVVADFRRSGPEVPYLHQRTRPAAPLTGPLPSVAPQPSARSRTLPSRPCGASTVSPSPGERADAREAPALRGPCFEPRRDGEVAKWDHGRSAVAGTAVARYGVAVVTLLRVGVDSAVATFPGRDAARPRRLPPESLKGDAVVPGFGSTEWPRPVRSGLWGEGSPARLLRSPRSHPIREIHAVSAFCHEDRSRAWVCALRGWVTDWRGWARSRGRSGVQRRV